MSSSHQDNDTLYQRTIKRLENQRLFVILAIVFGVFIAIGNAAGGLNFILSLITRTTPIEAGSEKATLSASSEGQSVVTSNDRPKTFHDPQEKQLPSSLGTNLGNSDWVQPTAPQVIEKAEIPKANHVTVAEPESPSGQNALPATTEAVQKQADGFLFDLESCRISGTLVKCELTITNEEEDARLLDINTRFSRLIDEDGNEYGAKTATVGGSSARRMVGITREGPRKGTLLTPGIPARALLSFDGVPEETSRLALLELVANDSRVEFRNVPVTRD